MCDIPPTEPRPDFLLIGAQKAGTTSLFFDLRKQPGIFIPDAKELRVLTQSDPEQIRASYRRHFAPAAPGEMRGDCSTDYAKRTELPGVPQKAKQLLGKGLKLIYMVRHPIDRLLSHHHHQCNADAHQPLDAALTLWPELLDNSRYGFQIEAWREFYPQHRLHLVHFDDYKRDRTGTVQRCCEFLGTDFDSAQVSDQIHNQSDGKPRADAKVQTISQWAIYQKLIRPLVPLEARLWLVRKLSPKAPPRLRSLPMSCVEPVSQCFENDRVAYERVTGTTYPWNIEKPTATG